MNEEYYEALKQCGNRYRAMILIALNQGETEEDAELDHFIWMFQEEVLEQRLSLMKLNRWLGYIQGCLIERGYTTVEAERDWTRPLFRPLDFPSD